MKDDHRLKENLGKQDVYIKLLGAFEIHSQNGILTESDFNGSRDVRFLVLLFLRPDRGYSAEELRDIMWEIDAAPTTYKKTISRICSSVRDTMKQYFPDEDLILFENSLYQVSPSFHIRSDYDEVQALFKEERLKTDTAERIDILLHALKEYPGRLLPSQTDDPAFALKIIGFEDDRLEETKRCLKLLYQAGRYYEVLEIGEEAFMQHHEEPDLAEWILRAYIAIGQIRPAKQLLSRWRKLLPNKTQKAIDLEIKSAERGK
ncbi:MAG: bacterial transcriptional activator domain-containing protein [Lachnospiraceae bacterium]|nr:bacterial transcriptional activator domain-containing protein [Lachnospiraceae bacterium]